MMAGISVWLLYTLVTYHHTDSSYLFDSTHEYTILNGAGRLGATCASLFLFLFGFSTIFIILLLLMMSLIGLRLLTWQASISRCIGLFILACASSATSNRWGTVLITGEYPGGYVGYGINFLLHYLDPHLVDLILAVMWCSAGILVLQFAWVRPFVHKMQAWRSMVLTTPWFKKILITFRRGVTDIVVYLRSFAKARPSTRTIEEMVKEVSNAMPEVKKSVPEIPQKITTTTRPSTPPLAMTTYHTPGLHFFSKPSRQSSQITLHSAQEARARILEQKLERFGIYGSVVTITVGPVVTLFEYQPTIDTKISTILAREDDLALALEAISLRIIAPIPGRSVVGFEVANVTRQTVHFSELMNHQLFTTTTALLPLALGQDTQGNPVVIDLATAPHLLVAGTTGSGKSVALQTMLMSLLCKYSPDDLHLILIDPKRLEFSAYADCAHLLVPIITQAQTAVAALRFMVRTMQERYEELAAEGVRTITEYRARRGQHAMPFIVIVIDELADLMMSAGKDIESLLIRLAQMSRAAGIHIIVATQRPSVDVITGIIKANFPARLALKVATKIDSRTIIDMVGAERLLGKGDMLFLDGAGTIRRLHGAYISSQEIVNVTDHIRAQRKPQYHDLSVIVNDIPELPSEDDALYQQVRAFLSEVDEVSISLLQRKFRIGYNRSARIIDVLQSQGLIASAEAGAKTRRVLRQGH